uniref:Odorant receptor n=1 Tax=Semiothisa cinerearia TaxID=2249628 RepID=A0A889XLB6_9NEOP|nr:odorant receptor [Semiothisa cinerearia]
MGIVKNIWKKITHTNALDQVSGALEMAFFEDVYRVTYLAGLSTTDRTVLYLLYSSIVKLMVALIVTGELWYTFTLASSLDEIAACVNVIVIQLITLFKFKNMITHKEFYQTLARSMETSYFDMTTKKRRELVLYWAKTHERYVKLLLGLGNCTLAAWHLYPLVDELDYNLMLSIRLPFHFDTPLLYPFTYLIVGIAFTYTAHSVMVTDLVMQAHMVPLICQLSVLADCFENIIRDCCVASGAVFPDGHRGDLTLNNDFKREYLRRLGNLVEQHKLILNHSMHLKAILSGPLLGQLAASGTLMCFIGFQATTTILENVTKCLMSLFYLGYNMFGMYIICRWCEEITNQSHSIGESVYCSGWETGVSLLPGVRTTILLVIARANNPVVFTAGGMYDLSLKSFTTLVKTSYSALTVLLRFRH